MRQPIEEMVDAAVDLITQVQEQPSNRRTIVEVPVLFVERGSARLPKLDEALVLAGTGIAAQAAKPAGKAERRKGRNGGRQVA